MDWRLWQASSQLQAKYMLRGKLLPPLPALSHAEHSPGSCISIHETLQQTFHSLDFRRSFDISDALNLLLQAQLHAPFRLFFRALSGNVR